MTQRELVSMADVARHDRDARIRLEEDNVKEWLSYPAGVRETRRAAHA